MIDYTFLPKFEKSLLILKLELKNLQNKKFLLRMRGEDFALVDSFILVCLKDISETNKNYGLYKNKR